MSYGLHVEFKLRKDQITLGDYLVDEAAVGIITETLQAIKDGKQVNLTQLHTVLQGGFMKSDEFKQLRQDYKNIKEDLGVFKEKMKELHMNGTVELITRLASKIEYIVGSDTWLEQLTKMRVSAAHMFNELQKKGCQFEPRLLAEYHKRYDSVIKDTSFMKSVMQDTAKDVVFDAVKSGKSENLSEVQKMMAVMQQHYNMTNQQISQLGNMVESIAKAFPQMNSNSGSSEVAATTETVEQFDEKNAMERDKLKVVDVDYSTLVHIWNQYKDCEQNIEINLEAVKYLNALGEYIHMLYDKTYTAVKDGVYDIICNTNTVEGYATLRRNVNMLFEGADIPSKRVSFASESVNMTRGDLDDLLKMTKLTQKKPISPMPQSGVTQQECTREIAATSEQDNYTKELETFEDILKDLPKVANTWRGSDAKLYEGCISALYDLCVSLKLPLDEGWRDEVDMATMIFSTAKNDAIVGNITSLCEYVMSNPGVYKNPGNREHVLAFILKCQ